jgi:hypothetical protein
LPTGHVGIPYNATLNATGGFGAYTWSAKLPAGLTLASNGHISGTPNAAVTKTINVTVVDALGSKAKRKEVLTIS